MHFDACYASSTEDTIGHFCRTFFDSFDFYRLRLVFGMNCNVLSLPIEKLLCEVNNVFVLFNFQYVVTEDAYSFSYLEHWNLIRRFFHIVVVAIDSKIE